MLQYLFEHCLLPKTVVYLLLAQHHNKNTKLLNLSSNSAISMVPNMRYVSYLPTTTFLDENFVKSFQQRGGEAMLRSDIISHYLGGGVFKVRQMLTWGRGSQKACEASWGRPQMTPASQAVSEMLTFSDKGGGVSTNDDDVIMTSQKGYFSTISTNASASI